MAMLGDLLASAREASGAFHGWLEASDPALAALVVAAATREGLTAAGFVRAAVADFSRFASEEDWATLISTIRDSGDPGKACLLAMVDWRLNARGCGQHSLRQISLEEGAADERPAPRPAH